MLTSGGTFGTNAGHIISFNLISNNSKCGINLGGTGLSKVTKNNFINNKLSASFGKNCFLNRWSRNYWDRPRLLPKLIFGRKGYWEIPWFNIDWRPAKEPYDIEV